MRLEQLTGTVERIVFHNPESGWCVLKVRVKGRRRLLSVVGHSSLISPGETIEAEGEWAEHSEHGERLLAHKMHTTLPRTATAAEKFLSSGVVGGIGPEIAARMVAKFGARVLDVIENEPELLREVEGIGPKRALAIRETWKEHRALRGVMDFLGSHGLTPTMAPRIVRTLGPNALSLIQENPYRLAREVAGIGFQSADLIARHLGAALDSEERLACALHDRLQKEIARGHCAAPADRLVREATREVATKTEQPVWEALENEIEAGRLAEDEIDGAQERTGVFPSSLAAAERRLAKNLAALARGFAPWGAPVFLEAPPDPKRVRRTKLSVRQSQALKLILENKISLLTGGPGTGKTTLIREVTDQLVSRGWSVTCCAPTGRAAQRLQEAAGVEAQTIHRLLGWDAETHGFRHREEFPLRLDLLIVDEVSMVGVELLDALVRALPPTAALLLVGDPDQLPSVQAGKVLASVLEADIFAHAHLDEIFRQASGDASRIVLSARAVLEGRTPDLVSHSPEQEFHFVEARTAEAAIDRVIRLVRDRIPDRFGFDLMTQVQVLAPMNKGSAGARELNRRLQATLNPRDGERIERFGQSFAVGDKVIATINDYDKEIFNGDVGRVTAIDRVLTIEFSEKRLVNFEFSELDSLSPAFAITVHKAQGSEYECVVIVLQEESAALLGRRLLYTAITRGKRLVVLVSSREALRLALRPQPNIDERWSGLAGRLRRAWVERAPRPETPRYLDTSVR